MSKEGICYIYVMLDLKMSDYSKAWTKIRNKINEAKAMSFPAGVLAIAVVDDFGNTSSLLIAMESPDKTYREMHEYTEDLTRRLRDSPETGNVHVMGEQNEEIAVLVDQEKLAAYGISQRALLVELATQGMRTVGGSVENDAGEAQVHVTIPYQSEYEIGEQIVYTDPMGHHVRLCDIADIQRRYAEPKSRIIRF